MPAPKRKSSLPVRCMAPLNLEEVALRLEERLAAGREDVFKPIPTGFVGYDRLMGGGLHSGDLHIIGGPQGIGKTALALQMAGQIAAQGVLVLFVCFEHSVVTLWERLLCQSSFDGPGKGHVTAEALKSAYVETLRERDRLAEGGDGRSLRMLDRVITRTPGGLAAWSRLSGWLQDLWLVTGDGLYTTLEALKQYLDFAFSYRDRVVLILDYVQQVPVLSSERALVAEERIERVLKGLKALALSYTNEARVLPVIAVAAADAEGLRRGRVHFENLWGNAVMQYEPDVAWVGNRDGRDEAGASRVRWALEKNRRGPSDLEFRHRYYGAAYSFELEGEPVEAGESWQAERVGLRAFREARPAGPRGQAGGGET